jgi:hypothetical protein
VRRARAALLAFALAFGCTEHAAPPSRRPTTRAADAHDARDARDALDDGPPHALFGCLTGDSAVYADTRPDAETGDTAGVWLTFYRLGDDVDGIRVLGAPDRADTVPFLRVQLSDGDSVAFDVPTAPADAYRDGIDTSRFLGRVTCDRLWGRQREHRDQPSRMVVYHRVYAEPGSPEPVP